MVWYGIGHVGALLEQPEAAARALERELGEGGALGEPFRLRSDVLEEETYLQRDITRDVTRDTTGDATGDVTYSEDETYQLEQRHE